MLRNYLTLAFRLLRRQKVYTFVNIFGLAVGLSAAVLIALYVEDELSYDRFYEGAGQIFRVTGQVVDENGEIGVERVLIDPPIAPLLGSELPEILHVARLTPVGPTLSYGDVHINSGDCYWTDPSFFDVFSLSLASGSGATALDEPFSLVLSRSKARALFGDESPIGKTVLVNGDEAFTVTGLFDDLPSNTHLPIDVLGSMATVERWFGALQWDSPNYATYIRVVDGASESALEKKLGTFLAEHREGGSASAGVLKLQPLTDIHLRSNLVGELAPNGDIRYVILLSGIAAFILLIAAINFVNLSTARATRRAQEVGVRKVLGAGRSKLVLQFIGESIMTVFIALAIALVITQLVLPLFNEFSGKTLGLFGRRAFEHLVAIVIGGLLLGVAAGGYPAAHLSAFGPARVLKGHSSSASQSSFRSVLVTLQFVISITLLIGTFVVYTQLSFIHDRRLGFDQERIIVTSTLWDLKERFEPVRSELLRHPGILHVAQSNPIPSRRLSHTVEAQAEHNGSAAPAKALLYPVFIDAHFFPAYGVTFAAGRNITDERLSDASSAFILNETAVTRLGFSDPAGAVGATLHFANQRGSIIGVVRDFHFESLHQSIAPMVFYQIPRNFRMVSIKMGADASIPEVLDFLEKQWRRYEPTGTFEYDFLDNRVGAAYEAELRLGRLFGLFAGLAIIVTCLGLFGMATYAVEERVKEIGIRKVLGASTIHIAVMLSKSAVLLVSLAFLVALPLSLYLMQRWLSNFAYQTTVSWYVFAGAGLIALAIAVLTVGVRAVRAAQADPVRNLRYE